MPPDSLDIRILWKLNRFKFQGIYAWLGKVWMKKNVIILICWRNIKHIFVLWLTVKEVFFFSYPECLCHVTFTSTNELDCKNFNEITWQSHVFNRHLSFFLKRVHSHALIVFISCLRLCYMIFSLEGVKIKLGVID